jgi:hypothetical protein
MWPVSKTEDDGKMKSLSSSQVVVVVVVVVVLEK